MKTFGIVSYNIYANFTNYGSALQSWALYTSINKIGEKIGCCAKLVDYCPDILKDKDPLNPYKNSWDKDEESKQMIDMTMPAIQENYKKFMDFYSTKFDKTSKYTSANFNDIVKQEDIDGFVCGSDTIFCIDEFGFDDGFYANYDCMKNGYSVSYAASFGDSHFTSESINTLKRLLLNFKALGIRENNFLPLVKELVPPLISVQQVVDPTLLLTPEDYNTIAVPQRLVKEKYLLLYSRRYNPQMEQFADEIAEKNNLKVVEISLRAVNAHKHIMRYDAGVEEFLALVRDAEMVVTNSFHGMIMSVQYRVPFYVFMRDQCDNKISEILDLFGLQDRMITGQSRPNVAPINYNDVFNRINKAKAKSLSFMEFELSNYRR